MQFTTVRRNKLLHETEITFYSFLALLHMLGIDTLVAGMQEEDNPSWYQFILEKDMKEKVERAIFENAVRVVTEYMNELR